MKYAFLSRGSRSLGARSILLPILWPSSYTFRAASLNSAIGRGLRKSKGVGFRGKDTYPRRQDDFDSGIKNLPTGIVRRTADPPVLSTMTRDGARAPYRHERRAAARAGLEPGGHAMRIRMGKREVKDYRETSPRRSRAARFNDPNSSFGKRNHERRERSRQLEHEETEHDTADARTLGSFRTYDGKAKDGRVRPIISAKELRAAESDRIALQSNPDGSKLSRSRLVYLQKTANGPPGLENRISRPSKEPYQDIQKGQNSARSHEYRSNRPTIGSHQFDHAKEKYHVSRADEESSNNFKDEMRPGGSKKQFFSEGHISGTPDVRSTFTQTMDKRYPISVDYTTPASEFLYGTSVVEAALSSRRIPRRKLYKLYIFAGGNRENADRDAAMERLARKNNVNVVRMDQNSGRLMDKMSGGRPHNGYVLESSPLPRLPVTYLGKVTGVGSREGFSVGMDHQSREEANINGTESFFPTPRKAYSRKPFVLFLDSIVDPGNLGGIIRTAAFLGVTAIAISTRNSVSFTPVVLKASAGASESMDFFSVKSPADFIQDSKSNGWKVYASVAPSGKISNKRSSLTIDDLSNPLADDPCILMIGNEGEGLRLNLRSKADVEIAVQGNSNAVGVDSLNVSVATGILCDAFLRRRDRSPPRPKQVEDDQAGKKAEKLF